MTASLAGQRWMDDVMLRLFNSIALISGSSMDDDERLCVTEILLFKKDENP